MAWPSSNHSPDYGFIQKLESLVKVNDAKLLNKKTQKKQIIGANAKVELTPEQIKEIIFYSPENSLKLFLNNNCSIYTFLNHNVLYLKNNPLDNVEVYIETDGKREKAIIPTTLFLQNYTKENCKLSFQQRDFFEAKRIKKTLEKITPALPKDKDQCKEQWKKWQFNINTEHICAISQKISIANKAEAFLKNNPELNLSERSKINALRRERNSYLTEFNELQRSYFSNLCQNYHDQENFCNSYSKQDFWTKIANFAEPEYKVAWKCQQILRKEKLSKKDIERCIRRLRSNDMLCTVQGDKNNSAAQPMPSCSEISDALHVSRLESNYHDCPALIANTGVVNIFRILAHFKKGQATQNPKGCVFPSFASVYNMYQANEEESKWPLNLCYKDPLTKKENCRPFVPGNHQSESYAQNNVVADIIFRSRLDSTRPKCQVTQIDQFNLERLTYKTGCWIVAKSKSCQAYNCPQQAYINGQKVIDFYTKGDLSFNYFKNKYNSSLTSLNKRVLEQYEMNVRPISSLTSARFFLEQKKKGLIHGMGCAEDLNPLSFRTTYLGQCTPMPFIIDGYAKEKDKIQFVIRTAVDDVHSPRFIQWASVFSAVSRYTEQHPLKTWNLHGIY